MYVCISVRPSVWSIRLFRENGQRLFHLGNSHFGAFKSRMISQNCISLALRRYKNILSKKMYRFQGSSQRRGLRGLKHPPWLWDSPRKIPKFEMSISPPPPFQPVLASLLVSAFYEWTTHSEGKLSAALVS